MLEPRPPSIFEDDDWEICEGQIDGAHHIIRKRATFPSPTNQERFDRLIILSWHYEPDVSGMPNSATHERMQELEDALEAGTEARGIAYQALSMTGAGTREWRYYAASTDDFIDSLHRDLDGHDAYPLALDSYLDPEWNGLMEFHQD